MQTFLNEYSYKRCARALDNKRLNKQLLEVSGIFTILTLDNNPYKRHPAVRQWEGSEHSLYLYALDIAKELERRGIQFENNLIAINRKYRQNFSKSPRIKYPPWWYLYKERIVTTHRAKLYIKDPIFYAKYKKYVLPAQSMLCCSRCNYFWPSHWIDFERKNLK